MRAASDESSVRHSTPKPAKAKAANQMVQSLSKLCHAEFNQKLSSASAGGNVVKASVCQVCTPVTRPIKIDKKSVFRDQTNERQVKNTLKEHIDKTTRKNAPTDEVRDIDFSSVLLSDVS